MARFTLEFKLAVVEHILSGQGGQKATANKFGTDHSAVRKWVAAYRLHGVPGLEPKQWKTHSAEFKESVILHMRQNNLSARATAAHFNILIPPIRQWERLYDEGGLLALKTRARGKSRMPESTKLPLPSFPERPSTDLSQNELLAEIEYLRAENACLKKLQALIQEKKKSAAKKKQR